MDTPRPILICSLLLAVFLGCAALAGQANPTGTVLAIMSRSVPAGWVDCKLTIVAAECDELRKRFIFQTGDPDVPMYIIKLPDSGDVDELNRFLEGDEAK